MPAPQRDVSIEDYKGRSAAPDVLKVDSATGHMAIAFQIRCPRSTMTSPMREGPVARLVVLHQLQQGAGNTKLEKNASQKDKDYIAAINWKQAEQCVAQGKAKTEPGRYAHNVMGEDGIARTDWGSSTKVLPRRTARDWSTSSRPPRARTAWTWTER